MLTISRSAYRWRRNLAYFVQTQNGPLLLLSSLFVIGVIFGALAVRSLPVRERLEMVSYLDGSMMGIISPPAGAGAMLLKQALLGKLKWIGLLWVLGISLVGVFGVMVLAFARGFYSGFVVAFLASEMGGKGLVLAITGHLPQSLIEVPALILAMTGSVAFSLQVIRSWLERRRVPNFYPALAAYTTTLVMMGLLLLAAAVVESYVSPRLVQMATTILRPQ